MVEVTFSDLFKDNPSHLNRVRPLDFANISTIPDSYRWSTHNEPDPSPDSPMIPEIDLCAPDAAVKVASACESWGIFQVVNHGVPSDVIEGIDFQNARLFSLSVSQKLKALRSPTGASGYGVARIAPFFDNCMWHEGFTLIGSPVDHAMKLWPLDYLTFCDVIEGYTSKVKDLVSTLLSFILSDRASDWIRLADMASPALQLNSYPVCPDPSKAMGMAPHTDTSLLTVLHQNDVAGLQAYKDGVGWVTVRPKKGALVVHVSDLLHILSNGRLPSVMHRVVMGLKQKQRYSVAYFAGLPVETELYPLGIQPGEERKYRNVTVAEYARIKAASINKALSSIAYDRVG